MIKHNLNVGDLIIVHRVDEKFDLDFAIVTKSFNNKCTLFWINYKEKSFYYVDTRSDYFLERQQFGSLVDYDSPFSHYEIISNDIR